MLCWWETTTKPKQYQQRLATYTFVPHSNCFHMAGSANRPEGFAIQSRCRYVKLYSSNKFQKPSKPLAQWFKTVFLDLSSMFLVVDISFIYFDSFPFQFFNHAIFTLFQPFISPIISSSNIYWIVVGLIFSLSLSPYPTYMCKDHSIAKFSTHAIIITINNGHFSQPFIFVCVRRECQRRNYISYWAKNKSCWYLVRRTEMVVTISS